MKFLVVVVLLFGCDGALEVAPPPPQMQRLVEGVVGLVGGTTTACSSGVVQAGVGADVWCAFYRPGAGDNTELWVLDVTRASQKPVPCDGTSRLCLRLTTTLWTGNPIADASHPAIHAFDGDTLIIYADATSTGLGDPYRGTISGWRPGWAQARPLTSPAGYLCHGNPRAAAAHCLDDVVTQTRNYDVELRAGSLTGAAPGPLMSVGRIRVLGSKGQRMWQAGFSPDGAWFLFSSPADGEDTEVLRMARATDGGVAAPVEIKRGAGLWQVAPDGTKLYFLDGYNYVDTAPSGTLTMMDFPALTNPTVLQEKVGRYASLGDFAEPDRGLGLLQEVDKGRGTLRILRDRAQPAQVVTVESGVNEFLVSPDLRYSYVAKPSVDGPTTLVVSNEGKGSCVAGMGLSLYSQTFAPDSRTLFWDQDAVMNMDIIEGWYAPSDRCAERRMFSPDLAYHTPVRDGLIYADSDAGKLTMTLKHAVLKDSVITDEKVVHEAIDTTITRGGKRFIVFTVSKGDQPGLYSYGPVP